jgi:hypothetical protein
LALNDDVTIRNRAYEYGAKRHWFDSETYAFNTATSLIDRDRFRHPQATSATTPIFSGTARSSAWRTVSRRACK